MSNNSLVLVSEGVKDTFLMIKKIMLESSDKHPEYMLDDADEDDSDLATLFKSYEVFEAGDWDDEGKYQHCQEVYEITTNDDEKFLMEVAISRCGSYFSDYYYTIDNVDMVTHEKKEITKIVDVYNVVKF